MRGAGSLVQAGNLVQLVVAWIGTSIALHHLLLFYPERLPAQRAARKKRLFAVAGTVALVLEAFLLCWAFGTADITVINALARSGGGEWAVLVAAALLTIAALLKSAQFPTHGWLTEVMEAPTPVSALLLLHAGLINAGGFLIIRFADVMLLAPGALAVLAMIGGFTALFGALVMLTQPAGAADDCASGFRGVRHRLAGPHRGTVWSLGGRLFRYGTGAVDRDAWKRRFHGVAGHGDP